VIALSPLQEIPWLAELPLGHSLRAPKTPQPVCPVSAAQMQGFVAWGSWKAKMVVEAGLEDDMPGSEPPGGSTCRLLGC
jgi:hypothetical protein